MTNIYIPSYAQKLMCSAELCPHVTVEFKMDSVFPRVLNVVHEFRIYFSSCSTICQNNLTLALCHFATFLWHILHNSWIYNGTWNTSEYYSLLDKNLRTCKYAMNVVMSLYFIH